MSLWILVCGLLKKSAPLLLGAVTIASGKRRSHPPARHTPFLPGMWFGSHEIDACSGGVDFRSCGRFPRIGRVMLALSQTDGHVSGLMTIQVPAPSATVPTLKTANIPVAGTALDDGTLRLSGSAPLGETPFGTESVRLTDWTTCEEHGDLAGQLTLASSGFYPGFGFSQTFTMTADVRLTKLTQRPAQPRGNEALYH